MQFLTGKITEHFDAGCQYVRLLVNKPIISIAEKFFHDEDLQQARLPVPKVSLWDRQVQGAGKLNI
jgi:hypothetical protein